MLTMGADVDAVTIDEIPEVAHALAFASTRSHVRLWDDSHPVTNGLILRVNLPPQIRSRRLPERWMR